MNQKKFPISTPQPRRSAHTSLNSHALLAESRTQARSSFWDLVRGIGILSIVMGHSCRQVIPYVYTYHLAVFSLYPAIFTTRKNTAWIHSATLLPS